MPGFLKRLWEGWKRVARVIGDFQARVILTVFYAVLVLPFGLAVRLFGDPLHIRRQPESWQQRSPGTRDSEWARRQW
jgi:hypothetical protein